MCGCLDNVSSISKLFSSDAVLSFMSTGVLEVEPHMEKEDPQEKN